MQVKEFDTVILGGGPAGFSAGIYAARGAVSTAIVDINMMGGQPSNYLELENYPGFGTVGGFDLMEKFEEHADKFGVEKFPMQEIERVDLISNPKIILTNEYEFRAKSVIIATGAQPMKLGVPGEKEFVGRGVSYCAVCDGAFYKNKIVAVVGGGNAAVEEAMYLTKFADKVYVIHRRDALRADKIVQDRAFKNEKIEFVWDSVVKEIKGEDLVNTVVIENVKSGSRSELAVNGVFPYIGMVPNIELFNGQIEQDKGGFILTDETMKTSVDGVFAVGDVRHTPLRQVITAASDGAVGAVYAFYLAERTVTAAVVYHYCLPLILRVLREERPQGFVESRYVVLLVEAWYYDRHFLHLLSFLIMSTRFLSISHTHSYLPVARARRAMERASRLLSRRMMVSFTHVGQRYIVSCATAAACGPKASCGSTQNDENFFSSSSVTTQ